MKKSENPSTLCSENVVKKKHSRGQRLLRYSMVAQIEQSGALLLKVVADLRSLEWDQRFRV